MIHLISIQFVSPACPSSEVRQSWKAKKIINCPMRKKKKKNGYRMPPKTKLLSAQQGSIK